MHSMLHDDWLDIPNIVILHSFYFEPIMVSVGVYKTGGLDRATSKFVSARPGPDGVHS
jgi:hypothetical protein